MSLLSWLRGDEIVPADPCWVCVKGATGPMCDDCTAAVVASAIRDGRLRDVDEYFADLYQVDSQCTDRPQGDTAVPTRSTRGWRSWVGA